MQVEDHGETKKGGNVLFEVNLSFRLQQYQLLSKKSIALAGWLCFCNLPENKTQLKLQFHDHTFPFAHHIFTVLSNFLGLVQIGDDEGDEEPSEHRKKHKKSSHHHPHSHRCLIINFSCATFSGNHSACDSDDSFLIIYDEENLQGTLQRPVPGWF